VSLRIAVRLGVPFILWTAPMRGPVLLLVAVWLHQRKDSIVKPAPRRSLVARRREPAQSPNGANLAGILWRCDRSAECAVNRL